MDFPICQAGSSPWTAIVAICWLGHAGLEVWLGKTEKTKAGSLGELVIIGGLALVGLLSRRMCANRSSDPGNPEGK